MTESFEFWQLCDWIILNWLIKLICWFYLISEIKFQKLKKWTMWCLFVVFSLKFLTEAETVLHWVQASECRSWATAENRSPRLTNWETLSHRTIWCHREAPPRQLQSEIVLAHTDCRLSQMFAKGLPPSHNGKARCVCCASQPMSGNDGICAVENRYSVVWEPGQYTTLAS